MDYLKDMKERQKEFLTNPRENISKFLNEEKKYCEGLAKLSIAQGRPEMLILFKDFHNQYSILVNKMLQRQLISAASFKDELQEVSVLQMLDDMKRPLEDYQNKSKPLEITMPMLKKSYASLMEILWNKIRRTIFFAGLNPKQTHLNLSKIEQNLIKLEKDYSIDLSLLKKILNGKLRNTIDHEKTYFEHPNFLVFMDERNGRLEEFYRINDITLMEELIKLFVIISALHHVEVTVMVIHLENLLKLDNLQLEGFCKTGKFNDEMIKRINQ